MKRYAIKREHEDKILTILTYDEEKKEFFMDVPENVAENEAPLMISLFLKRGIRHIGPEWSMRWVRDRIVPLSRQNIGQILRENHMKNYDEHTLLVKNQGRSCQDECYIEKL